MGNNTLLTFNVRNVAQNIDIINELHESFHDLAESMVRFIVSDFRFNDYVYTVSDGDGVIMSASTEDISQMIIDFLTETVKPLTAFDINQVGTSTHKDEFVAVDSLADGKPDLCEMICEEICKSDD